MSDTARRRAGVRVIVGVALTVGAYFPMVTGSVYAAQFRGSASMQGAHVSFDFFRRASLMVAVIAAVVVLVGMALWLPVVASRARAIKPIWLALGVVLALPIAVPAARSTIDSMTPTPGSHAAAPPTTVAPPRSLETCITAPAGCELPVFQLRDDPWRKRWPVWANAAFAVGLAVPFALLGWAYVWRVRRRSSTLVAGR